MAVRQKTDITERLTPLVNKYRSRCLWFLREDFFPGNMREALLVLDNIEKHGDREAFIEARRIREWLSPISSAASAS
jgi:uncharacterized protein (DUF3820 family)